MFCSVRLLGRQPSRRGHELVEATCGCARCSALISVGSAVGVGRLELGQRAVLDDLGGQLVAERELLEHVGVGRSSRSWSSLTGGSLSFSKRMVASCLGEPMLNSSPASA